MSIFNLFSSKKQSFFTKEEEERMVEAIRSAELQTSGEIRLFVESKCSFINPVDRAIELFGELNMQQTKDRNAVIVYIALKDKQLAVFGDEGIHQRLGQSIWNDEVEKILGKFNQNEISNGICNMIKAIGTALTKYFPYSKDDKNELSDGIVFGK